jgi:hypothetical protein
MLKNVMIVLIPAWPPQTEYYYRRNSNGYPKGRRAGPLRRGYLFDIGHIIRLKILSSLMYMLAYDVYSITSE